MASECCPVEPGKTGPFLDDKGDRIGINRIGTNPVAAGYRFPSRPLGQARRWQMPQPAE
jgi:hypothetical protein